MSTVINGAKQNEIAELESLTANLYENIFNINLVEGNEANFYFYNILNKVVFPDDISDEFIEEKVLTSDKPWTMLSYELYGTIGLWWVVYLLNKPDYIFKALANVSYKYIKPSAISGVLEQITLNTK